MTISVAIIGSGPSAFYTADALAKSGADCTIDLIERLPAPFGLIRYGVAPDHETTRKVSRAFDKTARGDKVAFFGNTEVGRDVSLAELRQAYDAVVLAVGAPNDRPLGIPGSDKKGVYGSAAFVGWYNGHPDFRALNPDLNVKAAAVVGVGNVALDVARLLVRAKPELEATDMAQHAVDAIAASPVTDVYLLGRRGAQFAAFTIGELREMGELEGASIVIDAATLPTSFDDVPEDDRRIQQKMVEMLRGFADLPKDRPKRVHFRFNTSPKEVLGGDRVEGLRVEKMRTENGRAVGTGETEDIPLGLVVAAIGYRSPRIEGGHFDEQKGLYPNDGGLVEPGLYAVGWAMRGPSGVIGTSKIDGQTVAKHIVEAGAGSGQAGKPGRAALEKLLAARKARRTTYADWDKIDAAEIARARPGAPRLKFPSVEEMLAALGR
ncbi:MAG: FAD-dependent oxidoreductase [Rhodospirillales bacterium]|nr:FAD-dependent oxidoreductase [Rhodospirillales bacterium]